MVQAFPESFVFGAASSAYQVEGGHASDGKGLSNWDAFCHDRVARGSTGDIPGQVSTPGNVFQDQTGDVSCDHYHRYAEDVGLMRDMGLQAYRLSISWPRVMPDGVGMVNEAGLAFYDRLVDALLAANITPWITLFHWDMPIALWEKGAWQNRDIASWFADYARVVVGRLSDRVSHWMTINEPHIFLGPSEHEGLQTSNSRKGHAERLLSGHNALRAHGLGAKAIRAAAKTPPKVGWAPIGRVKVPAPPPGTNESLLDATTFKPRPEDVAAAREATLGVRTRDFWNNTWLADPVVLGQYPADGLSLYTPELERTATGRRALDRLHHADDLREINQPLDFYGVNIYDAERVRRSATGGVEVVPYPWGHPQTAIRWFIEPLSLYYGPKFLYERYKVPIVITENGLSSMDWVDADGRVRDFGRIDYTRRYLRSIRQAIADGTDIQGYFHWSILDNFEWQQGYKERFGLIHVDYQTMKRTPKESSKWYAEVIRTRGASLDKAWTDQLS